MRASREVLVHSADTLQQASRLVRRTSLRNLLLGAVAVFALAYLLFGLLMTVAYWLTLCCLLLLVWFVFRQSIQGWLQSLRPRAQPRHRP